MTGLLRRTLRRLDDYTLSVFNPVFGSLGRHYQSLGRGSQRG